ncbi:MAG: hypothetical protein JWL81_3424 [Verrucomicrobiales bacterium]|nr:hypothetical protein [Verrucomicrobiales bacterium]
MSIPISRPTSFAPTRRLAGWRMDAARLAAELLRSVSPKAADEVLDLRSALLEPGVTPAMLLRVFLAAKNRLEKEHYLLFFRLRRVLEPNLGLRLGREAASRILPVDFQYRSLPQMLRRARQNLFEHDLALTSPDAAAVTVVWSLAAVTEE